jgi:hypothetical protein
MVEEEVATNACCGSEIDDWAACEHCGACESCHNVCEVCEDCTASPACSCCTDCYQLYCECCGVCGNAPDMCECCRECCGGEDHYCPECDGYTCSGCYCTSENMLGYGEVPDFVEYRGIDGTILLDCYHGYPPAPDCQPYFGMELEVEAVHGDQSTIVDIWNDSGHGWCTYDGSLSRGAECKTHPTVYEKLRIWLPPVLPKLREAGARAWGYDSCGLHLHLSRASFKSPSHQWRFSYLHVRAFRRELIQLAGRESHYAQFPGAGRTEARPYDTETPMQIVAGKTYKTAREVAVNVNEETIELRFWKGNLNPVYVVGAIALEHALWQYSRVLNSRDIQDTDWDAFSTWAAENLSLEQFNDILALCDNRNVRFMGTVFAGRTGKGNE